MKKFFISILFCFISFSAFTYESDEIIQTDNFELKIIDDKTAAFHKYNGSLSDFEIPSDYKGLTITKIDEEAFYSCQTIESVILPDSITSIGKQAFY